MSIKQQIKDLEFDIKEIDEEIDEIESKINREKISKSNATTGKYIGLAHMTNSTLRPLGTYEYLASSSRENQFSISVSNLENKKRSLERDRDEKKRELKRLEEKYKHLPEAKLSVSEAGIFIDGGKTKHDVIKPLLESISGYYVEFANIKNSPKVASYVEIRRQLEEWVKTSNLPEATAENCRELESYIYKKDTRSKYVVIDDKILVESDFMIGSIHASQREIAKYERLIMDNQYKRAEFQPTFWGKVFKSVGKKQREHFETELRISDDDYSLYMRNRQADLNKYNQIREKYIIPAEQGMKLLEQLTALVTSSMEVAKYLKDEAKYQGNINESTILKDMNIGDIPTFLIKKAQSFLDNNDITLTRESVIEAIFSSEQYKDIAQQLLAMGVAPQSVENSQSSSENAGEKGE